MEADYSTINQILDVWELDRNLKFDREYKGYEVRSIWMGRKVQFWVDPPDKQGNIKIHAAELNDSLPGKWGQRIERLTVKSELAKSLDEVWIACRKWL